MIPRHCFLSTTVSSSLMGFESLCVFAYCSLVADKVYSESDDSGDALAERYIST